MPFVPVTATKLLGRLLFNFAEISANNLAQQLRDSETPIISRIHSGFVYIDLRAVREDQVEDIHKALETIFS